MKTWQVLAIAHRAQTSGSRATHWTEHPDQEDLEELALDKLTPEDRLKIEAHLGECEACRYGFEDARVFADRLLALLRAQGRQDQRKAVRYQVRESAIVTLCHPVEIEPVIGQVMDASSRGLRIRTARIIYRGTQIQVQVEKAVVFGTVRYCRAIADSSFDVGLSIDQIIMPKEQHSSQNSARESKNVPSNGKGAAFQAIEILLVEDNPADVKLVELMFEEMKVKCHLAVAGDGVQALARLLDPHVPKPGLVLLDLNLPALSGLEVLKKMRQERTTESVPVAVFSSSTAAADLQRTTALGIRAYLLKPKNIFECADLRTNLDSLISEAVH